MKIFYYHLNTANIKKECNKLRLLKKNKFLIIGIEITRKEFKPYCNILIDPQHNMKSNNNMTSVEFTYNNYEDILMKIKPHEKIIFVTVKTDIDSITSMSLLSMLVNNKFQLDGDVILRLIAIAKSDRHGRNNWKSRKNDYFNFENYNPYGLPYGVQYMCSDYKLKVAEKVQNVIEYLNTGTFPNLDHYNKLVDENLKRSIKETVSEIVVENKLCYVSSKHRGATSKGYQDCPVVIAFNPVFNFGKRSSNVKGAKYTIAQYNEGYVNLNNVLNEINKLEKNWGGSNMIIGSPQDKPSKLTKEQVVKIVKKHLT